MSEHKIGKEFFGIVLNGNNYWYCFSYHE